MSINYSALQAEILGDPKLLGYDGKDDRSIADLLNEVGLSGETIDPEFVDASSLVGAVDSSDWPNASTDQHLRDLFLSIIMSASGESRGVPIKNTNIRQSMVLIFGSPTSTITNMQALQTRSASRAEVLFGEGVGVGHRDVAKALRG